MREERRLYLFSCLCGKSFSTEPDEYVECCRERVEELLVDRRHQIEFQDRRWVIAHPLRERLDGSLFECGVFWDADDPGVRGRFYLDADGTLGERVGR